MKCFFVIVSVVVCFFSCNKIDVFEKAVPFSQHEWKSSECPSFSFDITDTIHPYNFYLVLRNEDAYTYRNIWVEIQVKDPDSSYRFKREFTLANNSRWLGNALDDIIEHRIPFNASPIKLKKGLYTFSLKQIMREDPIPHVLAVGIRVQKVGS